MDPDVSDLFSDAQNLKGNNVSFTEDFERRKDQDVFRFRLDEGETVRIETDTEGNRPDTQIFLFDENGNLLAEDDDSGQGLESEITFTNNEGYSGRFFVVVTPYNRDPDDPQTDFATGPQFSGRGDQGDLNVPYTLSIEKEIDIV